MQDWASGDVARGCSATALDRVPSGGQFPLFLYCELLGIIALLAMILLLLPIVICNATTNAPARMSIVAVAAIFFVVTLCGLTRAKSIEIFVAGAT